METIFWGFVLRFSQGAIEASLTLLIGVLVAGILRRMVGPESTRKLFGKGVRGLVCGWLAGMLLPVCSLGVIPVAREMRRVGVPGGTVLAFVLAAPLLNPISFLYGLTLAEPKVIITFAILSLFLTTLAGFLWDRLFASDQEESETEERRNKADALPRTAVGPKRILAIFVTACQEFAGRDMRFYLIGIAGSAVLSVCLPFGSLQHTMAHTDKSSPMLMTLLAVPLYSSPLPGMMKIGLMFDHGNSIGAALVLFALGIGTSLGTLAWLVTDFGVKRISLWFFAYVLIVVIAAYACEPFLYDSRKAEIDHTHAFDEYSAPYPSGSTDLAHNTTEKLKEKCGPLEFPAVIGCVVFLVVGLIFHRIDRNGRLERFFTVAPTPKGETPKPSTRPKWDLTIPSPILGVISLVGLVVFSVVGAYLYYPDRQYSMSKVFDQYTVTWESVQNNTGSRTDEAIRNLEQLEMLVRKLEVGVYIRSFEVTPEQSQTSEDFREAIEEVRDELIAKRHDEAKIKLKEVLVPAYRKCKAAYQK